MNMNPDTNINDTLDEPRGIEVDRELATAQKIVPATEGDVTMQQLLDAMAIMARDIDELRAQLGASLVKIARHVEDAERKARESAETAQQHAGNAAQIVAMAQTDPEAVEPPSSPE